MKVHTLQSLKHCERAQSAFVQLHVRKTRDPLILTHQRDLPSFQALQYLIRLGHEHLPVERDRSERIWPTRPPLFPLNGRLVPPQRSLGLYKNTTECFHTHLQSFQDLLRLDSERQKLKTHLCLWTMDHVWDIWPFWAVTGKVHLQKHFKWTAEEELKLVTKHVSTDTNKRGVLIRKIWSESVTNSCRHTHDRASAQWHTPGNVVHF